jgi:hypothetical protein
MGSDYCYVIHSYQRSIFTNIMPTKIAVFVITIVIKGKFNRNYLNNLQFVRVPDCNI